MKTDKSSRLTTTNDTKTMISLHWSQASMSGCRNKNWKARSIRRAKEPRSYLVKTDVSTMRRNWSVLITTCGTAAGLEATTSSNRPTDMVPNNEAPMEPQTPFKLSTPLSENSTAGSSQLCGSIIGTPAQRGPPEHWRLSSLPFCLWKCETANMCYLEYWTNHNVWMCTKKKRVLWS